MRNYSFRRLTGDDLPLMLRWLTAGHVRTWWPDPEARLERIMAEIDDPAVNMLVVSLANLPFAYLQDHAAGTCGRAEFADLPPFARVMATFVGDQGYLGQGHAAGYVEARVRDLRLHYPMVAVGPDTADTRTIGIYTQAGFRKRRLASTRDGRLVQVMTHL